MAWARGLRRRAAVRAQARDHRERHRDDLEYLVRWGAAHRGVEVFVEPPTAVTAVTVVLVDQTGSWTRRAPGGPDAVRELGRRLKVPVHDVLVTGYPQRMRENIERARIRRKRAERAEFARQIAQLTGRGSAADTGSDRPDGPDPAAGADRN